MPSIVASLPFPFARFQLLAGQDELLRNIPYFSQETPLSLSAQSGISV